MYAETQKQWYSTSQERFLPDRYVEGTCYICGYENARGDQCDQCGNLLEANELIDPRSKMDGSTPELRDTEHFFLDLGKLQPQIVEFLKAREDYWRPNVIKQSLGQILANDLHGRAITRDLKWGIPVPVVSGLRLLSAIYPRPLNGPIFQVTMKPGRIGGTTLTAEPIILSGKIISLSML